MRDASSTQTGSSGCDSLSLSLSLPSLPAADYDGNHCVCTLSADEADGCYERLAVAAALSLRSFPFSPALLYAPFCLSLAPEPPPGAGRGNCALSPCHQGCNSTIRRERRGTRMEHIEPHIDRMHTHTPIHRESNIELSWWMCERRGERERGKRLRATEQLFSCLSEKFDFLGCRSCDHQPVLACQQQEGFFSFSLLRPPSSAA